MDPINLNFNLKVLTPGNKRRDKLSGISTSLPEVFGLVITTIGILYHGKAY
jgi:hypothetical protein